MANTKESKKERGFDSIVGRTHRLEICDAFTCRATGLRTQQSLLLEDERGPNEKTADDCQNYADDLEATI